MCWKDEVIYDCGTVRELPCVTYCDDYQITERECVGWRQTAAPPDMQRAEPLSVQGPCPGYQGLYPDVSALGGFAYKRLPCRGRGDAQSPSHPWRVLLKVDADGKQYEEAF